MRRLFDQNEFKLLVELYYLYGYQLRQHSQPCAGLRPIGWNQLFGRYELLNGFRTLLLKQSINITDSLGWNPRPGSPTVYVNKQCIYGLPPCNALDPTGNQVLQFICDQYTGVKPKGCAGP